MKRKITILLISVVVILGSQLKAEKKSDLVYTRGLLTVKSTTMSANNNIGEFGTKNIIVVWVQGPTDTTFVKTLTLYAGRRIMSLKSWLANSKTKLITDPATKVGRTLEPDVLSGATQQEHLEIVSTWEGKNPQGMMMPDGIYHVKMEMTQDNQAGKTARFQFVKGSQEFNLVPTVQDPIFAGLSLQWVPSVVAPDPEAPTSPLRIYSSYINATSCVLEWSDSQDNVAVTGYNIYNNDVLFSSSSAYVTSVKLPLAPNTTYNFTIKAKDDAGNLSAASPAMEVKTLPDTDAPTAPSGLYTVPVTTEANATSMAVSWSLPAADSAGVKGFNVYKNGVYFGSTTSKSTTKLSVTGCTFGEVYNITVKSISANDSTLAGLKSELKTIYSTSLTHKASFTLRWVAGIDNVGVTGYNIYKDGVLYGTSTSTSLSIAGLVPGNNYTFTVSAKDAAANISGLGTLAVLFDIVPPTTPSNLNETNLEANSFTLNWTASTDNVGVTKYDVYKNSVLYGSSTTTSLDITGLTEATPYIMTVKARDAAGFATECVAPKTVITKSSFSAIQTTSSDDLQMIYALNGQVIVDLSNETQSSVITITDTKGQLIKSIKASNTITKLSIPKGANYLVSVKNDSKSICKKLSL